MHTESLSRWLIPHHLGGSLHYFDIRNFSLRGFGFNGYFIVSTFDPPPPPPPFTNLGPPLGGKFSTLRGTRITWNGGWGIKATR